MALILVTTSIAVTVGTTTTLTHGLSIAPNWTTISIRSNSTTVQIYVMASTTQVVYLYGTGGIAAAVAYADVCVQAFHSIIQ